MKSFLVLLLAGLAADRLPAAVPAESIARFSNDDRLAGSMESLTPELLVWRSPLLEKPAPFFLKNVVDLTLPAQPPDAEADHVAVLTLTNGDTVRGRLASVTDGSVSLDTWFAGRMHFNRLMVSGLRIEGKSPHLYRGPTGLEGWTQSGDTPAWSFGRAALVSSGAGGIAKDGLLPDECAVAFDVAWKGDAIALKVILFSDEVDSDSPGSGYEFSFQRGSVYLRNGKTQAFLGSTHSQALMESDRVKVEIRASRKSGKASLLINGRVIEVWSDPDAAKGKAGSCLHFVSQNVLPTRISNITVSPWNGVVEDVPNPRVGLMRQFGFQDQNEESAPAPKAEEKPKEGRMELANGDSLEGEVTSIQDGLISVKTPLGDVQIPVSRLRTVALRKVDLERSIRRNGDIRASLPDGSSLVFRLDGVGQDTLTGSSQNFGEATFRMAAFNRIEFNIYDVALEDKRAAEDW